jgi:hypothetical protein
MNRSEFVDQVFAAGDLGAAGVSVEAAGAGAALRVLTSSGRTMRPRPFPLWLFRKRGGLVFIFLIFSLVLRA